VYETIGFLVCCRPGWLVDKDDHIRWSGDLSSRRFFASHSARGASSNVADKIVKEITAVIAPTEKQLAAK
jgi:hypothetical protein